MKMFTGPIGSNDVVMMTIISIFGLAALLFLRRRSRQAIREKWEKRKSIPGFRQLGEESSVSISTTITKGPIKVGSGSISPGKQIQPEHVDHWFVWINLPMIIAIAAPGAAGTMLSSGDKGLALSIYVAIVFATVAVVSFLDRNKYLKEIKEERDGPPGKSIFDDD